MLFYIKRHLWLEITVTILLASLGLWGMHALNLPLHLKPSPFAVVLGVIGAAWLGVWTLLVQYGYRVFKGSAFAEQLTASLAKEYANPSPAQILLGGLTAACARKSSSVGFSSSGWVLSSPHCCSRLLIWAGKTFGWLVTGQSFITTIAMMQLREEGKVGLDDPVVKYLPWFKEKPAGDDDGPITIEQLLSHSSGLQREAKRVTRNRCSQDGPS